MRICDRCRGSWADDSAFCPEDGDPTRPVTSQEADLLRLIGVVLDGKYRVMALIGRGGMGAVYRAEHVAFKKSYAVKVLHEELAQQRGMVQRFITESETLARLDHENIVSIVDRGTLPDGRDYMVMEYLRGEPLSRRINVGQLFAESAIISIGLQVARALQAAHAIQVIHRDLKPDNIYLCWSHPQDPIRVKLLDFGIARLADPVSLSSAAELGSSTIGMLVGTPFYMSPEQIKVTMGGGPIDPRSDIYSLGVVLYEMAVGWSPFKRRTPFETLNAHLSDAPPAPRTRRPELSLELEQIILHCLEKDRESRFSSVAALATALRSLGGSSGEVFLTPLPGVLAHGVTPGSALASSPRRRWQRWWRPLVGAAALVALGGLAVGGVVRYLPRQTPASTGGDMLAPTSPPPRECPATEQLSYGGSRVVANILKHPRLRFGDLQIVEESSQSAVPIARLRDCKVNVAGYIGAPPTVAGSDGGVASWYDVHHFADDLVAVIVHPSSPLTGAATVEELGAILRQERPGLEVIAPPTGSYLRPFVEKLRGVPFLVEDRGLSALDRVGRVERTPGALAIVSFSDVVARQHTVRVLTVAGKPPSDEAYPAALVRPLHLLARREPSRAPVAELVRFLTSEKGQRYIDRLGFRRATPRKILYGGSSSSTALIGALVKAGLLPDGSLERSTTSEARNAFELLTSREVDVAGGASEEVDGPGSFQQTVIARDVLNVVGHPSVTLRQPYLTRKDLRAILEGKLHNWQDLRGPDLQIKVLVPPRTSPLSSELLRFVGLTAFGARVEAAADDREVVSRVLRSPGAIGFAGALLVPVNNDRFHLFAVDGHPPDDLRGYPLVSPIRLAYRRDQADELAPLLEALLGDNVQCHLRTFGLRPISAKECNDPQ